MIKLLQFSIYYVQKRTSVFLGFHRTKNPLSLRWRWQYWVTHYDEIRKTGVRKEKPSLSKGKPKESF